MKEIEKFRKTNLARIAYSVVFFGILYSFDITVVLPVCMAHLAFSMLWMGLIETEVLVEDRHWWTSFIPGTLDSVYLTVLIYVTGNVFSFVIIGYFITATLGSLTLERNYGFYTVLVSGLLYGLMGLLVVLGYLPALNIFDPSVPPPTFLAWIVAAPVILFSLLLVNRIVSKLFRQLHEELQERARNEERTRRDLKMARRVQESILPREGGFPERSELSFGSTYLSLESVGGDLYDVFDLGDNTYGFMMADVSGHGVPAALVTTMAKVAFAARTAYGLDPAHVIRMVNGDMFPLIGDLSYFLTALYGVVNLERGELKISRAGHPPGLLLRKSGGIMELNTDKTMYIGVLEDLVLDTRTVQLEDGDRLILFTDGITEALNGQEEMYGDERFHKSIASHAGRPVKEFVRLLIRDLDEYCAGIPVEDDRALLCVDFHARSS